MPDQTGDPACEEAGQLLRALRRSVLVVPSLADIPESALAGAFVFRNGPQPDGPRGPFGFQPDVFDSVPGDPAYSPLRRVNLITWRDPPPARILRSADDIAAAEAAGELSVERTSAAVNMPMTRWPGGTR